MKLIVNKNWQNFRTSIYLQYDVAGRRHILCRKDGLLCDFMPQEAEAVEPIEPLIEMPEQMADEFIKAVVDYASEAGIKTENENLLKGKLQATEKHLEDMRLAFNKLLQL